MNNYNVTIFARKDISEYLDEIGKNNDGKLDCDNVSLNSIFTKENKRLNRELGIIGINKTKKNGNNYTG